MLVPFADLSGLADADLGASRWIRVDQGRIDGFAATTEDRNWLHTDPARAAAGPYGSTIAHGFLTLSLMAPFLAELLVIDGAGSVVNYGLERVRFPAPVRVGARVRGHGQITQARQIPRGVEVRVGMTTEIEGEAKPACVAELVTRAYV